MKILSLYVEKDTFIHKLAPVTKLMYAITSIIVTLLFPSLVVGIAFFSFSLLLSFMAKITKRMITLISVVIVLSISILIIQGMFYTGNSTLLFSLYKFSFYKEGFFHAFVLILRLFNMIISFGILILTTRPSDLIDNLVQKGLSPRLGYVLSSVLQIIPQMLSTTSTIIDAQRSRGLETEGNIVKKLKAFFALIGPLVLSSLVEARERAMAIEIRGFGIQGKRTTLREIKEKKIDIIMIRIFQLTLLIAVIWRIVLWII